MAEPMMVTTWSAALWRQSGAAIAMLENALLACPAPLWQAPFAQGVLDSVEALPARPYTREELRAYLASTRQKCHTTLLALTEDQARRPVEYPSSEEHPITLLQVQL